MAIVFTTVMIVVGGILATASHGVTINGMFWMMTVARGIVGFGAFLQDIRHGAVEAYTDYPKALVESIPHPRHRLPKPPTT
jgi:hypothetical protein